MDYRKEKFPLNHFVLWTKGWYKKSHNSSDDKNVCLYEELKSVLALDGYSTKYMNIYDMCWTILNAFEHYNYWCRQQNLNYMTLTCMFSDISRYKEYGYNESESIIMTIRSFFMQANRENILLSPPHYSRKLYKKFDLIKGNLLGDDKQGLTYKEMNNVVQKFKWDFPYEAISF